MKTMPYAASAQSHLTPRPFPFEDQSMAGIIDEVEQRVRIMCRMAQLYRFDNRDSGSAEQRLEDLGTAMEVLYEFVDRQMDTLSVLNDALGGEGYVSLNTLKKKADD